MRPQTQDHLVQLIHPGRLSRLSLDEVQTALDAAQEIDGCNPYVLQVLESRRQELLAPQQEAKARKVQERNRRGFEQLQVIARELGKDTHEHSDN